jgi:hypothetical protein
MIGKGRIRICLGDALWPQAGRELSLEDPFPVRRPSPVSQPEKGFFDRSGFITPSDPRWLRCRPLEPRKRAQSPPLAAGLASESLYDRMPYGRSFPAACCRELQMLTYCRVCCAFESACALPSGVIRGYATTSISCEPAAHWNQVAALSRILSAGFTIFPDP